MSRGYDDPYIHWTETRFMEEVFRPLFEQGAFGTDQQIRLECPWDMAEQIENFAYYDSYNSAYVRLGYWAFIRVKPGLKTWRLA